MAGDPYRWLLPALGTFILWGLWGVFIKLASEGRAWREVYVTTNLAVLAIVAAIFVSGGGLELVMTGRQALYALAAGVTGALGYILLIYALELGGKASVVIPLSQLSPAVTVVLAFLVLGESITARQAAGVVLALAAVVLLGAE